MNFKLENSAGKYGFGIPKDIQDYLPKADFFSSGFLLHSCCTIPKSGAFAEVKRIQEGDRKMWRQKQAICMQQLKKNSLNLGEAYLQTVFQIKWRHGVHSRSSWRSLVRLEQKREVKERGCPRETHIPCILQGLILSQVCEIRAHNNLAFRKKLLLQQNNHYIQNNGHLYKSRVIQSAVNKTSKNTSSKYFQRSTLWWQNP